MTEEKKKRTKRETEMERMRVPGRRENKERT